MKHPLVIAAAALMLLSPVAASAAQGRGGDRGGSAQGAGPRGRTERAAPPRLEPPQERPRGPVERGAPSRGLAPGQTMPPNVRGSQVRDFERYRLRPPPPGYDWVQVGRDIYLTQRSTGMVLEAIPGGY